MAMRRLVAGTRRSGLALGCRGACCPTHEALEACDRLDLLLGSGWPRPTAYVTA